MKDNFVSPPSYSYLTEKLSLPSKYLGRDVAIEVFLPPGFKQSGKNYPLLLLNDGQDSAAVQVKSTLEKLVSGNEIKEIIAVGITAGDRMQEYGVAGRPDYRKRGSKASLYTQYIIEELVPYLLDKYPIDRSAESHAAAGYSLGGLSAVDITWNHPEIFSRAGAFSGSFWWRKRDAKSLLYSDNRDRLMHLQVREGKFKPGLKFWFQTGTMDEQSDRNKNGVIDSIDDTRDLMTEFTKKGYKSGEDLHYLEIAGGEHNQKTWAEAMPKFLTWAFGRN